MFHEMLLKLYFVKCSKRNISQCILAFRTPILKGSYISLTHKQLPGPTHTQPKKVIPTQICPHPAKKEVTLTHTKANKGLKHPYPPTLSQEMVTPTHT